MSSFRHHGVPSVVAMCGMDQGCMILALVEVRPLPPRPALLP